MPVQNKVSVVWFYASTIHCPLLDRFIDAAKPEMQYDDAELNATHILTKSLSVLGRAVAVANSRSADANSETSA